MARKKKKPNKYRRFSIPEILAIIAGIGAAIGTLLGGIADIISAVK